MFADNELFNAMWTTGSLSAIAPIVKIVGWFSMCLISIGGFFMVILPIMRNVINGIVVVAPNLCDKIDEAHRNKLGLQHSEGGNQVQMVVGSLLMIILSFFPNFKALSDFDEGIRDPKTYMIKAVPMMCVYVFIGVFIFYGYPSKFAEKFSDFGRGAIDIVLNNVDPQAWIEKIPTNLARPDFSTGDATDKLGKNTNKLSKSIYSAMTSKYSAMTKENRTSLSHEIEQLANGMLGQISDKSDSSKFKMTVETRVMGYDPQVNQKAIWPEPAYDEDEHIYVYQFKAPVSDHFNVDVPGGTQGDHILCILKFYELAGGETATIANVPNIATVDSSAFSDSGTGKETTWTIDANIFALSKTVTLNGVQGTATGKTTEGWTVKFKVSVDELKAAQGTCNGIHVYDPNNPAYQHTVTKVEFGSGYSFKPVDETKWNAWSQGESPTPKKSSSGDSDGSTGENDKEQGNGDKDQEPEED